MSFDSFDSYWNYIRALSVGIITELEIQYDDKIHEMDNEIRGCIYRAIYISTDRSSLFTDGNMESLCILAMVPWWTSADIDQHLGDTIDLETWEAVTRHMVKLCIISDVIAEIETTTGNREGPAES
tara:strand:- start:885 stop:1262 length:378 start_codon:yes stop_codon:yes gene_type:complete